VFFYHLFSTNPERNHTMNTTATIESTCPECDASIAFDRAPLNGQIAQCNGCGSELEVISAAPIQLELAPEVEEDWGE
jgi:alpha-aminoadipate/glutamate carrier protein LysW